MIRFNPLLGMLMVAVPLVVGCGADAAAAKADASADSSAAGAAAIASASAPRPVRVAEIGDGASALVISAAGTLGPRDVVPLAFKVGGVVRRITVNAGERVRAGQLLAEIDPQEIDAGVARARAAVDKAERDAARAARLLTDSVVTRTQYDDAQTALAVARADLQAVAFDRARAVITAPASGLVLARRSEAGQLVTSGQPILEFGSGARGVAFRAGLPDHDVVRVKPGDAAEVVVPALPGRTLAGRIVEVAGAPTAGLGTYEVVIALDDADGLPSGLVGRVAIRTRGSAAARTIPIEALVEADADSALVFALTEDGRRASRRRVRIGRLDGREVRVVAGLDGMQRVVTEGAAYLDDGDAVRVLP